MNSPKTIGILQCYHVKEPYRSKFGDIFDLFENLMKPREHGLLFRQYNVSEGRFPAKADECQRYLITGSPWGVYDTDPSIARLLDFIRECYYRKIPQVGICFGHQALAHALGGRAELSDQGLKLGVFSFRVVKTKPWMDPAAAEVSLLYSHQDQVTALPPKAEWLGGDTECTNRMFVIEDLVLGIQGHPEFTLEYFTESKEDQIERKPAAFKNKIRESLTIPMNADVVARWMAKFLS